MKKKSVLIIGGHPRSGTTLLNSLCNTHPSITTTFEFKSFMKLKQPVESYLDGLAGPDKKKPILQLPGSTRDDDRKAGRDFYDRYIPAIRLRANSAVLFSDVVAAYRTALPDAPIIGDKTPRYVFVMEKFLTYDDLLMVMIYRDPRDVAVSTLEKVRTEWKGRRFAERLDTPEKIAESWAKAVTLMEKNSGAVFSVQYERLIRNPEPIMASLGRRLGVDPEGFDCSLVWDTSIGRYKNSLSNEGIRRIETIAGPMMEKLGYGR